ncbi:MAG: 4Fe-4S dicluster domain-containing protein [Eggerthellaceae bacterium]|nr:4Fe-4S dicluster domain-containing protein [Eggerthellaceae bacterium]
MTQYAIVTDLNRCVGCLACSVACKAVNGVEPGNFWIKTLRIGPNPTVGGSGDYPDVEMYFMPVQCQHCEDPCCVEVCPTGASQKQEDGTVQIDKSKCIGCQFCVMSCPYGVRYLNETERIVEKCTLCEQLVEQGGLPQCVAQCGSRARFFGDLEKGIGTFETLCPTSDLATGYEDMMQTRTTLDEWVEPYTEADVHCLTDAGNGPQMRYILRNRTWQGEE